MKSRTVGILTLLVAAGTGIFALAQNTLSPANPPPTSVSELPPTTEPSAPGQCYYNWAYEELPDISAEFQTAVRTVVPEAEARATAFGENCVYQDGSATFGAMETDFYVVISVSDLTDNETLGTLIEKIIPILDGFTPPRVPGPKEGFVEFTFRNGENQRVLRVPIPLGRQLREQGLRGAELIGAIDAQ